MLAPVRWCGYCLHIPAVERPCPHHPYPEVVQDARRALRLQRCRTRRTQQNTLVLVNISHHVASFKCHMSRTLS